jgi:hypothetical protein
MSIRPIADPFAIVERLRGMFVDALDGNDDPGIIPEQMAGLVPEAAVYRENGENVRAVDYNRIVAVLIEAVKEQQIQIKQQEHSLKDQKAQVSRLRAEIERVKNSMRVRTW